MRRTVHALAVCVLVGALTAPATAQQQRGGSPAKACHNHDDLARHLGRKYKEEPVAFGLQANGNLLQVYTSARTGSWTILSTRPNGLSCIIAVGKSWEDLPALVDDTPA